MIFFFHNIYPLAGGTTSLHPPPMKLEPKREYDPHPTSMQRSEMLSPSSKADSVATTLAQRCGTLGPGAPQRSIVVGLSSKSLVNLNTLSTKHSSDEMVKATAVAAGARIVTPCDMPLLKSSGNSLPSNVHYIRTGLATTLSKYSSASPSELRSQILKPAGAPLHNINQQRQTSPRLNASGLVIEVGTKIREGIVPQDCTNCGGDDEHVNMDICENHGGNNKGDEQVPMDDDENLRVDVKKVMKSIVIGSDVDSRVVTLEDEGVVGFESTFGDG